jgi:hypothetical protein
MAEITMDLAAAYPADAGLASWQRTCRLVRGPRARVELEEVVALARETQEVMLSLMTPCEPKLEAGGIVLPCAGGAVKLTYDRGLGAEVEPIALDDARLREVWGERLYRVVLRPTGEVKQGVWKLRLERAAV